MDNNTKKEFTVNGFMFGSKDDVELAKTELGTVKYIDKKIENRNVDTILSVYQGALERKMFRTPVGYAYMHDLQKRMLSMGMEADKIPGIPIYQVYNNKYEQDDRPERTMQVPKKKRRDELKARNSRLVLVNIILLILVIAMFVISLNAKSPNILNYRSNIQNEYAEWDQELTAREKAVREKERELNIAYIQQ